MSSGDSLTLRHSEAATESLRRIAREQVARANAALARRPLTDKAVHDARKQLTRARATLRLLRPALGGAWRRGNATLRDAARPLSAVRDGRALLDTFDKLSDRQGSAMRALHPEAFRRALARERMQVRKRVLHARAALRTERGELAKFDARARRWKTQGSGWDVLGAGLQRTYGRGRDALHTAVAGGSSEDFHDWRKQAKYLWHQLELLEPLWPGPIGELADQVHKLADYLGEDHDLCVLRARAIAHGKSFTSADRQQALVAFIDCRRVQLQQKAVILGRRLYEEKPAVFERHLRRYWRLWRQEPATA